MFFDFTVNIHTALLNLGDSISLAPYIAKHKAKDIQISTEIAARKVKMGTEEVAIDIARGQAAIKSGSKDLISETAWTINPHLGNFVDGMQQFGDKVENTVTSFKNLLANGEKVTKTRCSIADHLFVKRGYTHHGIYIGNGKVMHYADANDMTTLDVRIHTVSFEEFAGGQNVYRLSEIASPLTYSREEAVERAKSRLCERDYSLFGNNCENFVRWCRCGRDIW